MAGFVYIKIRCRDCGKRTIAICPIPDVQQPLGDYKIKKHRINGFFSPVCRASGKFIPRLRIRKRRIVRRRHH